VKESLLSGAIPWACRRASLMKPLFHPSIQGWLNSTKYEVIHLFLNKPGPKEKKFAEEIIGALMFSLLHHGLEI
jgi:hypothetical protein